MNFKEQVDKRAIFNLLGCYCCNPKLILNDKYSTCVEDYPEAFHRTIWGAITNIARKGNIAKITALEIQNELVQYESAKKIWESNNGWDYIENAIEYTKDKLDNIAQYYDDVRKYSILRDAQESLKLDISFLYDENDELKLEKFNGMTSDEVLTAITNKQLDFNNKWNKSYGDNYSFKVGDGIKERLNEHKEQNNTWGYPFQSAYMTTVYRGMRPKKFIIRSSISGGCKTRSALADACNMACDQIYDWNKHEWIFTGQKEAVLFISTELEKEEVQDIILAHVSGIEQDRIEEWRDITEEEERILDESAALMESYDLLCEYMPDFTIDSIKTTIESYTINYGITACFFDYINDSPSLYAYYIEKTHMKLRPDQILFMFSQSLKSVANKYCIFLGSSTQLNDSYKDDANKDAGALKGSKAIIEKADGGILALPVTPKDLKKLKPILEADGQFSPLIPNMSYWIFKNRGGKWKAIVIWTRLNLGTMREMDCFVTDYKYDLVTDIEKTIIDFELTDVGEINMIETDADASEIGSKIANELSKPVKR